MSEIVHWSELQNVVKKPTLKMVIDDGEVIELKCLLKKEARGNGGTLRKVLFDKKYVDYWLNNMFSWFYSYSTAPFKVLASVFLVGLIRYLKEDIKIYKLHGHDVVRLEDLGIENTPLGMKSIFEPTVKTNGLFEIRAIIHHDD